MMSTSFASPGAGALEHIAAWLGERRGALLEAWLDAVRADPTLVAPLPLGRRQFFDHIPQFLDSLEQALRAAGAAASAASASTADDVRSCALPRPEAPHAQAAQHGHHRWQHGYTLTEVMAEWGCLHRCLIVELQRCEAGPPALPLHAVNIAYRLVAEACHAGVTDSAAEFERLQRVEASDRMRDLEQALAELRALEQQRAQAWHEATHDLRSSLNAVQVANRVLTHPQLPEAQRAEQLATMQRGLGTLGALMQELLALARLDAGRDVRHDALVDAAELIAQACEDLRALATERGLALHVDGPRPLLVVSDAAKLQRILQNLVGNALRYTVRGGVEVSWAAIEEAGAQRWSVAVRDTGPGLPPGMRGVAAEIERATHASHGTGRVSGGVPSLDESAALAGQTPPTTPPASSGQMPASASAPAAAEGGEGGEGIGLTIVRRLCALLDGAIEVDSQPQRGTLFRLTFPRQPGAARGEAP